MKEAPPPRAEPPAVTLRHERTSDRSLHQGSARLSIDVIALPCSVIVWLGLFLPWQAGKANASSEVLPSFSFRRVFYHVASRRGHVVFLSNQSPSVASFRELNQTSRSGGICPAPPEAPLLQEEGPGTDWIPAGGPGGLWHAVSDGASAGFPLCHWLLAQRGAAAVWLLLTWEHRHPAGGSDTTAEVQNTKSDWRQTTKQKLQKLLLKGFSSSQVKVVMSAELMAPAASMMFLCRGARLLTWLDQPGSLAPFTFSVSK